MPDPLTTVVAGATGACAAINGWYFARYARNGRRPGGRRLAACVLAVLFWGIALQAASVLLDVSGPGEVAALLPAAGRLLVAAGTLAVTAMIARRGLRG